MFFCILGSGVVSVTTAIVLVAEFGHVAIKQEFGVINVRGFRIDLGEHQLRSVADELGAWPMDLSSFSRLSAIFSWLATGTVLKFNLWFRFDLPVLQ